MNNNYVLGLDVGITSLGWSLIDQDKGKLVDMGVHMFEQATPAQDARLNRSARRTLRRRNWRKKQLKNAFVEFGLISKEEIEQPNYLSFTVNRDTLKRPIDNTVYHLRLRALKEQVSLRELLMALYNICGTRGHFLMENINFSGKDSITFSYFKEQFYEFTHEYVEFNEKDDFEKKVLKPIFDNGKIKANELKSTLKSEYTQTEEDETALLEILKLICGYACDLKSIDESVVIEGYDSKKIKLDDLLKMDTLTDFLNNAVEIHDVIAVSQILKTHNYICEVAVEKLDEVQKIQKLEHSDPDSYKDAKKAIQNKMSKPLGERLRVVKNMENKYPNGLYVKEASAILHKQQEYYPELITDAFIEVCIATIKARIPYFIGPLSSVAKNAWLNRKDGTFKYSYEYSKNNLMDEETSIKNWKDAMRSRCTYLPDKFALPKGSFVAETFSLLNELNILQAKAQDGEVCYLTQSEKIRVFDELFLKNTDYTSYLNIEELLHLSYFGPVKKGRSTKFKNKYSLYHNIVSIFPQYRLHSITELFTQKDKIDRIEDIILNLNLFDEEQSKINYFIKEYGIDLEDAKKLSKLKSNGFYAFSKEFIMETPMNTEGDSLLDEMFSDSSLDSKKEQMELITNATDLDGNPINFAANKYIELLKKNPKLSIDLLIKDGKPFIPISRPVIRALNECFKLYEEIIRTYGVPSRVVIETARDLKDSSQNGEVPAKHFDEMKKCFDYVIEQGKNKNKKISKQYMEDWDTIEPYLLKNKKKVELYIRQNGRDMITGDPIDIQHLEDYEMDHILPRGFGDNSMDNLMLIKKELNSAKSDRVPLEYIENEVVTNDKGQQIVSSDFKRRCYELHEMKLISDRKLKQLMLASTDEAMGFINRNLVDTRYIIRELMSILKAYNQVNHFDTHIVSLRSAFTTTYRNAFNMKKNRNIGDQHHAHDASLVAIADMVLSTYYPHYDERGNSKAYKDFLKQMKDSLDPDIEKDKSENQKLYDFIRRAYQKRFGNYPNDNDSLVSQIKATVPLYSVKAEKNYKGAFFDATIYPQYDKKKKIKRDKGVLGLLGVNNDQHIYSSINCVAVDFYKYTDKKGKKVHVAVHIPKVVVNEKGEINKEKYIKLIKEYYKVPELLDENGNIKEYYFRMRVFKNDLIYDTNNYTIQKFNIGSIVNKKLEMKHLYVFSYDEIYKRVYFYKKELATRFDFKLNKINPDGTKKFSDYKIKEIIDYSIDNLMDIRDIGRYRKTIEKLLSDKTNYQEFLEYMAYLDLIVNRNCTPPTIVDRYIPVASTIDSKEDKKNINQYIKIKSSILGIRYWYNEKGTLIISGPKMATGKYSKIKKEDFSWKICSDMLQ